MMMFRVALVAALMSLASGAGIKEPKGSKVNTARSFLRTLVFSPRRDPKIRKPLVFTLRRRGGPIGTGYERRLAAT